MEKKTFTMSKEEFLKTSAQAAVNLIQAIEKEEAESGVASDELKTSVVLVGALLLDELSRMLFDEEEDPKHD